MIESTHNIFMFWNSGFDESPELIRACANSWKHHHEGTPWKIHLLDEKNVFQYMAQMQTEDSEALKHQLGRIKRKERCGDIVKFTDLLRLALLDNFGGVWADATVFCQKPLDAWIDKHQKSLLAPKSHEANRRHEAWFLINLHQSAYLSDWKNAFRRHIISGVDFCDDWKFQRTSIYYWMLRLGSLNPQMAARIWNSWFALRIMKKQPYFSINYCAEHVLLRKHRPLAKSGELFLSLNPDRCCPNRKLVENPEGIDFADQGIIKLNHKWNSTLLLNRLKGHSTVK